MSAEHFTAVIEVSQTITQPATPARSGYDSAPATPATREVVDVARIVVRAGSLDALRAKVVGHVALLDEEVTE